MRAKGLGRGLDALLGEDSAEGGEPARQINLRIDRLQPGRYQPRTKTDDASLQELAASIKSHGVIQPILVRPLAEGRYEIIAGERRWRAARLAGVDEIPVQIREVSDAAALAMALIENLQREDLNPLEQARGVQRLISEFHLTHQEAAEAIGRSRAAVSNLLRLLHLPNEVQELLLDGKLEMGHARALLALEGRSREEVARKVAGRGLSVRQTEALVRSILQPKLRSRLRQDRDVVRLQEELSEALGTTVEIRPGRKGAGKLVIRYASVEHLEQLLARLKR